MARPIKNGVDYFSFDVGALRDKKIRLLKGEFGSGGILIFLYILCSIYEENGYFKKWTEDDCILVSDEVGCGCNSGTVAEVVKGCFRRSLFDKGVFTASGVLTSAGIQRRFIRAASQRDSISIIKEYWLLDIDDREDVPASIVQKILFKNVSTSGNVDKTYDNTQSKVKESKVKESKEKEKGAAALSCPKIKQERRKYGQYGWVRLADTEYSRMAEQFGEAVVKHYIQYVDESAQQTGNKNKWKDWNLTVRKAIRNKWGGDMPSNVTGSLKSYDDEGDFLGR